MQDFPLRNAKAPKPTASGLLLGYAHFSVIITRR